MRENTCCWCEAHRLCQKVDLLPLYPLPCLYWQEMPHNPIPCTPWGQLGTLPLIGQCTHWLLFLFSYWWCPQRAHKLSSTAMILLGLSTEENYLPRMSRTSHNFYKNFDLKRGREPEAPWDILPLPPEQGDTRGIKIPSMPSVWAKSSYYHVVKVIPDMESDSYLHYLPVKIVEPCRNKSACKRDQVVFFTIQMMGENSPEWFSVQHLWSVASLLEEWQNRQGRVLKHFSNKEHSWMWKAGAIYCLLLKTEGANGRWGLRSPRGSWCDMFLSHVLAASKDSPQA